MIDMTTPIPRLPVPLPPPPSAIDDEDEDIGLALAYLSMTSPSSSSGSPPGSLSDKGKPPSSVSDKAKPPTISLPDKPQPQTQAQTKDPKEGMVIVPKQRRESLGVTERLAALTRAQGLKKDAEREAAAAEVAREKEKEGKREGLTPVLKVDTFTASPGSMYSTPQSAYFSAMDSTSAPAPAPSSQAPVPAQTNESRSIFGKPKRPGHSRSVSATSFGSGNMLGDTPVDDAQQHGFTTTTGPGLGVDDGEDKDRIVPTPIKERRPPPSFSVMSRPVSHASSGSAGTLSGIMGNNSTSATVAASAPDTSDPAKTGMTAAVRERGREREREVGTGLGGVGRERSTSRLDGERSTSRQEGEKKQLRSAMAGSRAAAAGLGISSSLSASSSL